MNGMFATQAAPRWPMPDNQARPGRTNMLFPRDLQHDVRDFMAEKRIGTIAFWSGIVSEAYREAALTMGLSNDPILVCLQADGLVDARTLWAVHDLMAAHWRAVYLPDLLRQPVKLVGPDLHGWLNTSYAGLLYAFHTFLGDALRFWRIGAPHIVRMFCKAVVQDHNSAGQRAEAELCLVLREMYPNPG
jgi:hypothetical protein